jgi:hypothetical protein
MVFATKLSLLIIELDTMFTSHFGHQSRYSKVQVGKEGGVNFNAVSMSHASLRALLSPDRLLLHHFLVLYSRKLPRISGAS